MFKTPRIAISAPLATFESVDSFIKPNLLFQMTGAKDHPCKQTGLRDVLNILGNPLNPELYSVVPDRFDTFTYQLVVNHES
jgi:hypothetical protein